MHSLPPERDPANHVCATMAPWPLSSTAHLATATQGMARLHHIRLLRPAELAAALAGVHKRGQAGARQRAGPAGGAVAHKVAEHAQRQVVCLRAQTSACVTLDHAPSAAGMLAARAVRRRRRKRQQFLRSSSTQRDPCSVRHAKYAACRSVSANAHAASRRGLSHAIQAASLRCTHGSNGLHLQLACTR